MNTKRFDLLIRELRDVQRLQRPFDMCEWVADEERPYDCNTAACALGWLARSKEGHAEGMRINEGDVVVNNAPTKWEWFDISEEQYVFLFMPESYAGQATIDVVLARVQDAVVDYMTGRRHGASTA